jgi:hypothetical protein
MRVSASASTVVVSPSTNNLFADNPLCVCNNAFTATTSPRIGSFHFLSDSSGQVTSSTSASPNVSVSVSRATVSQLQNTERKIVSRSVGQGYFFRNQRANLVASLLNKLNNQTIAIETQEAVSFSSNRASSSAIARDLCVSIASFFNAMPSLIFAMINSLAKVVGRSSYAAKGNSGNWTRLEHR